MVDEADFSDFYGYMPSVIPGIMTSMQMDEKASFEKQPLGAIMSLENLPPGLPFRKVVLYTDVANVLCETVLSHDHIIRVDQARHKWTTLNREMLKKRSKALQKMPHLMTQAEVEKAVQSHKKSLEMQQLGLAGDAGPQAAAVPSGLSRRQQQAAQSLAAPAAMTTPKKDATAKAVGRATGSADVGQKRFRVT